MPASSAFEGVLRPGKHFSRSLPTENTFFHGSILPRQEVLFAVLNSGHVAVSATA